MKGNSSVFQAFRPVLQPEVVQMRERLGVSEARL
jgi:hypothetical protein